MSVILEFDKMPQNCEKCRMLLKVSKLCAYCMATGFQIKYDETDLRDGMCPLEEKDDNSKIYVHGHWKNNKKVWLPECSVCKARPFKGYIPSMDEVKKTYKYCPNCGAKMDESEGE